MALKKSQKSLKSWTKQKWRTKSGKPSAKTGERYLPEKAIGSVTVDIPLSVAVFPVDTKLPSERVVFEPLLKGFNVAKLTTG